MAGNLYRRRGAGEREEREQADVSLQQVRVGRSVVAVVAAELT